jgi:hypothetical protein
LPSINLGDLVKDNNLAVFLGSRAFRPPWAFTRPDYEAAKVGITSKQTTHFSLVGHPALVMFMEEETLEVLQNEAVACDLMEMAHPLLMYGKVLSRTLIRNSLVECIADKQEQCRIQNSF